MIERPDACDLAGLAGLMLLLAALGPLISRAHFVFAVVDIAQRGLH
ncbi:MULTISPECIES: hypothetical protein [unclassified Bradyrhizobium]|nr:MULTISPECIES: hypothetical protein [unclassified Bradyrhizobium]